MTSVETVCGMSLDSFQQRTPFKHLIAIDPTDRFNLAVTGQMSTRLIDLIAPVGKGTRGLIVAPPKAGKTMLLEQIARAILTGDPDTRLIILLIDERPEEVTHFRRSLTGAEVFASSSDQPVQEHIDLSELMLAHIRTELECGHHVVVMLDSLTRLVRAFNLRGSQANRSRTLSGGVEAEALQIPRRFLVWPATLSTVGRSRSWGRFSLTPARVWISSFTRNSKARATARWFWIAPWPKLIFFRRSTCPPAAPAKRV
ncbi:MAG: hypothetical protein HC875_06060 [Anaerolineales bacterium]|nr:hypothetical protein [Anaerolineales bacterium]